MSDGDRSYPGMFRKSVELFREEVRIVELRAKDHYHFILEESIMKVIGGNTGTVRKDEKVSILEERCIFIDQTKFYGPVSKRGFTGPC